MNLFNLFATLQLDNSDYEKKLDQSQKSAKSFSSKIGTAFKTGVRAVAGFATGVVAASAALAGLAVNFINAGSEIDDNAQKLGISTDAYQYWSLVLQRAGSDASNLSIVIRNLTTFTNNLSTGQADALLTLQKLGIGYEDFMKMNTEEQLYAIVEALQGMEDQTEKVQIAQEIFGNRVYQELLPLLNMEQGSLEDLREEFEELGLILSEDTIKQIAAVGDKIDNFTNSLHNSYMMLMANFLPEIELITEALVMMAQGTEGAIDKLTEGFTSLISKIATMLPGVIETAGDLILALVEGMVKGLSNPDVMTGLVNVVLSLITKIVEIIPTLVGSIGQIATALVRALIRADWGSLIVSLLNAILDLAYVQVPYMLSSFFTGIIDSLIETFTTKQGLQSLAEFGISLAEAIINGLISGVERGINLVINAVNSILGAISKAWSWAGIPEIPDIPPARIPRVDFAEGGMFPENKGTLYALAGEEGAEIVAHGSRGTGVANVEQIADAQYMAMQDYDLRGAIRQAAAAVVNGVVSGLREDTQSSDNTPVIIRIGDKDFNGYIVNTVNGTLRAQGRKSLRTVTAY